MSIKDLIDNLPYCYLKRHEYELAIQLRECFWQKGDLSIVKKELLRAIYERGVARANVEEQLSYKDDH